MRKRAAEGAKSASRPAGMLYAIVACGLLLSKMGSVFIALIRCSCMLIASFLLGVLDTIHYVVAFAFALIRRMR